MDSVFIFRSSAEEAPNTSYDAIVVEQWTVVDVRGDNKRQLEPFSRKYNTRKLPAVCYCVPV